MAKDKKWNDWSDLMKGNVGQPAHPLHKPIEAREPLNKTPRPPMPSDAEIRAAILKDAPKQATDQQLFGHLVPSEEQVNKAERDWKERFNDHFNQIRKPVEDPLSKDNREWGTRGSIYKDMTEEERTKRNMELGSMSDSLSED